jgi:hypothetical protein
LVSEYNLAPASSLLSKLNSSKSVEPKEYDPARQSYRRATKSGYKQKDFNEISYFRSRPEIPRGMNMKYTGFFDPVEIYNNGQVGSAHLTMPKFFFEHQDEGMSNSHVLKTTLTLPYKDTKKIKKVNLFWLDDSYMNSHNTHGSLKPDDETRTFDEESKLSGKTGLSFKYSDNDLLVDQIVPNSPASRTGKIAPGDTILGFANPADLDETSTEGPIHWDPFSKLDKKNAKGKYKEYFSDFSSDYKIYNNSGPYKSGPSVVTQIKNAIEEETAPLEMIPKVLFSGPPDTFIYLLIRPKSKPTERVIVPIRRKVPSDFKE